MFRVTGGMLHVTGDGLGGLVTNKEYRDYHCVLEIKWGVRTWGNRIDRTKDSGLLVHSIGADGGYNGIWMPSIEAQIIEGGFGDFILVSGNDKDGNPVPLSLTSETGPRPRRRSHLERGREARDVQPAEPQAHQLVWPRPRLERRARLPRQERRRKPRRPVDADGRHLRRRPHPGSS